MPQTAKTYSAALYDAIEVAARAHHRQVRKGTEIPYIVHPLAVAGLLIRAECPEHLVVAALLHDVLEDTPVTVAEIQSHFGRKVSELVTAVSEPDKKAPWEKRKAHTIQYPGPGQTTFWWLPQTSWITSAPSARDSRATGKCSGAVQPPARKQKWYYESLEAVFTTRVRREPALSAVGVRPRSTRS
jgi:hypothetical protein